MRELNQAGRDVCPAGALSEPGGGADVAGGADAPRPGEGWDDDELVLGGGVGGAGEDPCPDEKSVGG